MKRLSFITLVFLLTLHLKTHASPSLNYGVWLGASYIEDEDKSEVGDEAFIIYLNKQTSTSSPWDYSAELRIGPGSFTDPDNNGHGDEYSLHKAWLGYQLHENHKLIVGKSQVPFGWKTTNFWPGDMFLAAYGDQMDVGIKWQAQARKAKYTLAYYRQDDWESKSTDTTDDNKHWGGSNTYRKVDTLVADVIFDVSEHHKFGISYQDGELEELITQNKENDGSHAAYTLYWLSNWQLINLKASYIHGERELPEAYYSANLLDKDIKNERVATEISYINGNWHWLINSMVAKQSGADDWLYSISPGVRYDYGPGWVYLEYLKQDGWFDRDMNLNAGDFSAWYLSVDLYW